MDLHGSRIWTLLDSAAGFNLIHSRHVDTCSGSAETVVLASAKCTLTMKGTASLQVQIGGTVVTVPFRVCDDLAADCILGLPWLKEQHAVLDFERSCVHFGQSARETVYWDVSASSTAAPILSSDLDQDFPVAMQGRFDRMLERFSDVFKDPRRRGTRTISHHIRVTTNTPVRVQPYRVSDEKKRIIQQQVFEMLQEGVIAHSMSPWSSPVVLVAKKDGSRRFCVDYRRVNDITPSEPTPMPIISETIQDLGAATVFSCLDLKSGYWQIPMSEESKAMTAFSTPDGGHYEFNVMPFGLRNAPATFQRLMSQQVLAGYLREFVHVYLDDIIVFSRSHEEHLEHLARVFERLQQHGLVLSQKKCQFAKRDLQYLGLHVYGETTSPTANHLRQIADCAQPTSRTELRSFIGLCNWVRDYVPRFAETVAPLTDMLSAKKKWCWTTTMSTALEKVRAAFREPIHLHRPVPDRPFVLQTDASGVGIAAVLFQPGDSEDQRRIVSFASARLKDAERRYHVNEQECLALIWAIKRYRPLLEGRRFTVKTDSQALTWLQRFKDTKAKLLRWTLLLQEFDFQIEHCPGKLNELPDVLSRDPDSQLVGDDEDSERLVPPAVGEIFAVDVPLPQLIKAAQQTDALTQRMIVRTQDPDDPVNNAAGRMSYEDDALWVPATGDRARQLYVPAAVRRDVLRVHHDDAGHPGYKETDRAIRLRYFWEEMPTTIRQYVRRCATCVATKPGAARKPAPLAARRPTAPWHTVSVDLMGPYPKTNDGKTSILVVTDTFTRWVEAFSIGNPKTPAIVRLLEEQVFSRYGYPRVLIADNGPQFTSGLWKRSLRRWGVRDHHTGRYHARANPVERRNQEVKKGLRARLQGRPHTQWARQLPAVLRDLRTRRNAATGYTPSQALLGYTLPLPGDRDLHPEAAVEAPDHPHREERLEDIRHHQLLYQRRYTGEEVPDPHQVGDQVMIRGHLQSDGPRNRHAGFHPKWLGPYNIRDLHSGRVYTVDRDGTAVRVPAFDVKPAAPPEDPAPADLDVSDSD